MTDRHQLADDAAITPGMEAQLARWRRRIAAGERRRGWKIGFNVPAVQAQLGISEPVIGHLTSAGELAPGGEYSVAGGTRVGIEPEIAARIASDLLPGADLEAARSAIEGLGPAIEVVDIDRPFDDLTELLAGNVFHRAVMIGATDTLLIPEHRGDVSVRVWRNGVEETAADVSEAVREAPQVVRHVARLLGRFDERLRAGDTIICGSLTPIVWVEPGDRIEVEIEPLGRLEMSFS